MITYAERVCFRFPHLQRLAQVVFCVDLVADSWGNELRCHELARAVHRVLYNNDRNDDFPSIVVDGKCGLIEHSWLLFHDGVVLDPYVPGRLPSVQIIDAIVATSYCPGKLRTDIRDEVVDRLVLEMRATR